MPTLCWLQGWIPRSGVLYGTDMVLYRNHPAAVHSEYCVVLLPVSGQKLQLRTWSDLQVCLRLVNQVGRAGSQRDWKGVQSRFLRPGTGPETLAC